MPVPKAEAVADLIAADITRGLYPAGRKMPSWADLGERYGVDRRTAGKALTVLRERGLLVRNDKGEMVVREGIKIRRRPRHQQTTRDRWRGLHLAASAVGLRDWAETLMISDVPIPADAAAFLDVAPDTPSVVRGRIHGVIIRGDRVPVQLSWTWFHPAVPEEFPIVREANTGRGGMWSRFEDAGYVLAQTEVIRASPASPSDADALDVVEGGPMLEVWRTCSDEPSGRVLEVTLRLINPDLHELVFP